MKEFKIESEMNKTNIRFKVLECKDVNIRGFFGNLKRTEKQWRSHGEKRTEGWDYPISWIEPFMFKSLKKARKYIKDFCKAENCGYTIECSTAE